MTRTRMPQRRIAETSEFVRDGSRYRMTVGRYPNGEVGEIFLSADRSDSLLDVLVHDAAILVSLLLQQNVPLQRIAHSLKRDALGLASSPIGAALDRVTPPEALK